MPISWVVTLPAPTRTRSRTRRAGSNRRRRGPLRERLPDRAALRSAAGRALRASLPAVLTVAGVGGVIGGGVVGYRWLTGSPRFALASVEVRGAGEAPRARVERAVEPALGENVFRVSLEAIERRLRGEPWVADVEVRRRLPDGLIIDVEQRRPAALVDLGGLYLVDEDGRAFKRADLAAGEADGLLVVTGIHRDAYRRAPEQAAAQVREAIAAAGIYAEGAGRPPLGEVHTDLVRGLTLYTRAPVVGLRVGAAPSDAVLRSRLAAFDAAWAALAPGEREQALTFHLDRDGWPLRVAVGFAHAR